MADPIRRERILKRDGYWVSYNTETRQPNYVSWVLTAQRLRGRAQRAQTFFEDPELPNSEKSTLDDYRSSGYDRGHMCPAGDNKWNQTAMIESFYLSNICPQRHNLNSGDWRILEEACREWARRGQQKIYIVAGPIFKNDRSPRLLRRRVRVPDQFFKLLLCTDKGKEKGIAFLFDNRGGERPLNYYACSIDDIEHLTGINFFASLNVSLQNRLESQNNLSEWEK